MQTWNGTEAGPIQVSKIKRAWSHLGTAFCTWRNREGRTVTIFHLAKATDPQDIKAEADEAAAKTAIGERYAWTLTRKNAKAVLADIEAASAARLAAIPTRTGGLA